MRYILSILILFISSYTFGQGVEFTANAPTVIELGEQFRLTYTVNKQGTNLRVPSFEDFDLLMGPSTGRSFSTTMVNGVTTRSEKYTYTYILEGVKAGKHTLSPATITVDGKQYTSNAVTIEVVAQNSQSSAPPAGRTTAREKPSAEITEENLFLRTEVSRRNLYMGEGLLVTLKVYSKVDLVNLGQSKFPTYDGFLTEEVPNPQQRIELVRQNYNGSVYDVAIIQKILLFPQHTGEIVIDPFELECMVRQQLSHSRNFFDDFFGNYRDVRVRKKSKPITITVKELPQQGRPLGYNGAVGKMSMRSSISTDTIKANEALTYTVTISGNGNLRLIQPPVINFPPDFEVYEPKINRNLKTNESGVQGTVTFEYLAIPRYAGNYKIPGINFSYFDPASKTYKSIAGKEFNIRVGKGEGQEGDGRNQLTVQSYQKEDVRYLGEDIRYIQTGDLHLRPKGVVFFNTLYYWLGFIIPLVLFLAGVLINKQRIKANADISRVKNRAANKMARKRMKLAATAMRHNDKVKFYDEVLKALWGYMSFKLNIDKAELNRDNISEILEKKAVDKSLVNNFIELLDECEFACYAPGGETTERMEEVYRESIMIITRMDKAIK